MEISSVPTGPISCGSGDRPPSTATKEVSGDGMADITPSRPAQDSWCFYSAHRRRGGASSTGVWYFVNSCVLIVGVTPQDSLHNPFGLMLSFLLSWRIHPLNMEKQHMIFGSQVLPVAVKVLLAGCKDPQYAYSSPPSCPDLCSFRFVAVSQNLKIQTQITTPAVNPASTDMPITYPGSCDLGNKYGV